MTPYEKHKQAGHRPMWRHSPDAFVIIEECECGARFLHNPAIGYPVSLDHDRETAYKFYCRQQEAK